MTAKAALTEIFENESLAKDDMYSKALSVVRHHRMGKKPLRKLLLDLFNVRQTPESVEQAITTLVDRAFSYLHKDDHADNPSTASQDQAPAAAQSDAAPYSTLAGTTDASPRRTSTASTPDSQDVMRSPEQRVYFSEPADWTDIILVVKEREFHFCHTTLCNASPVFKANIPENFTERDDKWIKLTDDNPSELEKLLLLLSPKHQLNLTEQNLATVLPIANKYKVTLILDYCEKHFITLLPPSFHLDQPNNLLCPLDFLANVSKEVCHVDLNDWLVSSSSYGSCTFNGQMAMPWWCALLVLYHVAKVLNLSKLKNIAWKQLMCTSSSSVWLSSIGQNPHHLPSPFQPLCNEKAKINYAKARFALIGLKTMPFFTSLDPEERNDVLLSFITFEADW